MKVKMKINFDKDLNVTLDIEENEIEKCLRSDFFKIQDGNFIYIINTKNIDYIIYQKEN